MFPSPSDPFWGNFLGGFLAEIAGKAVGKVGKTLAGLWDRARRTPKPLITETPTPFNTPPPLPLTLTPLVGREADFAALLGALHNNRLVTVTGVGGVGKTALAQTIARWTWEEEHAQNIKEPRGVPYLALDALSSGRDLADFIRRKLVPDAPPPAEVDERARQADAVRVVAERLNRSARLLVLDNFESALDAAGASHALDFVRNLVAATTDAVRILVTSRRVLNLTPIEAEFPLEPLEEKYAVDLFYERAGDAVSPADRKIVAEICRLEDCLPLGIELAAAAVQQKRRPLKEMLDALRVQPLDVEIADALGYPARQRGLAATLRYSYAHLPSDAARRLFCAFSVFRGGADRDAVKYVDGTDAWERALGDLVAWKLVNVEDKREPWRYSMLPTTRAFSALQLQKMLAAAATATPKATGGGKQSKSRRKGAKQSQAPPLASRHVEENRSGLDSMMPVTTCDLPSPYQGEGAGGVVHPVRSSTHQLDESQFHRRHAEYYVRVAARFDETPMERWREIEEEWENIKAGADWAVKELEAREDAPVAELLARVEALPTNAPDAGLAGAYAYQLYTFVFRRGPAEGREWLGAGLIAFHRSGDKGRKALMCNQLGLWLKARGEYAAALEWYGKSVALCEELGDKAGLAKTYNNIGLIHMARGEYAEALDWYGKSVALCEELGDKAGLAATYNNIGGVHKVHGDYAAALEWYEKSVALCEELRDKAGLATSYNNIAGIHQARGEYAAALEWYEKSVALCEGLGDKAGLAATYNNIGMIHKARGDYAEALAWYQKSVALCEELGDKAGLAVTYNNIAGIHHVRGDYAAALDWYGKSVALCEELGDKAGLAITLHNLGGVATERNNLPQALDLFTRSRDLFAAMGLPKKVAEEEEMIARVTERMKGAG